MDLCELSDVKDWLQIDPNDTSQDARLTRLITATSADFLNRINRPGFAGAEDYTELVEVMNWQTESRLEDVFLTNYPVNSVTSVTINEVTLPQFDSTQPDVFGWVLDDTLPPESRQKITLRGLFWPIFQSWFSPRHSIVRPDPVRVQVAYEAGYDEIPADVTQAVIEWIAFKKGLSQLQAADQTNEWVQMGQYQQHTPVAASSLKAMAVDMPASVEQVIAQYRRPVIG
jgi:hypothetical protein